MSQRTVRIIAIIAVAALIGTLAVGLVFGGGNGDLTGPDNDTGIGVAPDGAGEPDSAVLDGPHVVVLLCSDLTCPRADEETELAILADLQADPRVRDTQFITAERWYELFLEVYGDQQEFVDSFDPDTIPSQVQVWLRNPGAVDIVAEEWSDLPGIEDAYAPPQVQD